MSHTEQVVMFGCAGERLVGIVSQPADQDAASQAPANIGVVIIVGGPQYRAGSHRQFVLLARVLADNGIPVLRFDYRGMGDSPGSLHTFENVNDDVTCAIDALMGAAPSVQHVTLWGLCDGASAALLYCHATRDSRVNALCLLNPWVRSEASLANTRVKHYYVQRLMQKSFWRKLLSGKVAVSAVKGLMLNIKAARSGPVTPADNIDNQPYQTRMAVAWSQFNGPMLLILSGNDYTAKEFLDYTARAPEWAGALDRSALVRHDVSNADHTFSDCTQRLQVEQICSKWLMRNVANLN